MQSLVNLVFAVGSLSVAVANWHRVIKPDILLPGVFIGAAGGVTNALAAAFVMDRSPTAFMFIYAIGLCVSITASGLYLAGATELPGLWPRGRHNKAFLTAAGAAIGVAVGLSLWRVGLRGAPEVPDFMRVFQTDAGPAAKFYYALLVAQSGLVEEPMYRLFAVSATAALLRQANLGRTARVAGAVLVSSVAFGAIPTHSFALATFVGLLFGTAYLKLGLIPLIIAHVVTNAVQFPLLLGWWRG